MSDDAPVDVAVEPTGQPAEQPAAEVPSTPTPAAMPQQRPAPQPAPEPQPQPSQSDDEDDDEDDELELPRNVRAAQKLRRENKNLRRRTQEAETAANDYQARATAAEEQLTRYEVASEYGISNPTSIALIGSGSREEMEQRAIHLAALHAGNQEITPPAPTPPPSDRPVEGLRPGASPEPPAPPDDSYPASWRPNHLPTQN